MKSLFLFSFLLTARAADNSSHLFEEGNRLYREGNYEQALASYQQILESGQVSGEVYYNIGNCHFKLGDLGRTILNYERALRRMPADSDVQANLELMRSLTADEITPLPVFWPLRLLDAWLHLVPLPALQLLTTVFYVGAIAALILLVLGRSPALRLWSRRAFAVLGVLFLIAGLTWLGVRRQSASLTEAVVLAAEVQVKSAPSEESGLEVFTIHEGTKVRIDQQAGEWSEIVLQDGKVGWVKSEVFEVI